jgi:hypothetical protein
MFNVYTFAFVSSDSRADIVKNVRLIPTRVVQLYESIKGKVESVNALEITK